MKNQCMLWLRTLHATISDYAMGTMDCASPRHVAGGMILLVLEAKLGMDATVIILVAKAAHLICETIASACIDLVQLLPTQLGVVEIPSCLDGALQGRSPYRNRPWPLQLPI